MRAVLISLCFCCVSPSLLAISLEQYLNHISREHPELSALDALTGQYQADIGFAEGAFDAQFKVKAASRLSGYYDGLYGQQQYVQPLRDYNAEVFAQYRISDGNLPIYEQELRTLSGGETALGVRLSLLRDRDTDKNRFALKNAELSKEKWLHEIKIAQSAFFYDAIATYLDWQQAAQTVALYQEWVDTTSDRRQGLEKRVAAGDLAKIALIEFDTRLMERQIALTEAKRKYDVASQKLSYFAEYDDALLEKSAREHTKLAWPVTFSELFNTSIPTVLHPAVIAQNTEIAQVQQKKRLADNNYLPELDLELSVARDIGSGLDSLQQTDSKIALNFSVPIGRNQATAEQTKARLTLEEKRQKREALIRKIDTRIAQAKHNVSYAQSLYELQTQQVELAARLFQQEQFQFEMGASDFFLLNNRESDAFKAKGNAIKAEFDVYQKHLEYLAVIARLDLQTITSLHF